jgi:hypothetical protein
MAAAIQSPLEIRLSKNTSDSLLSYVAEAGEKTREAVDRFVEEAVSHRLLALRLKQIRERFSDMTPQEIEDLVEEAVAWARSPEGRACE